MFNQKLHYNGYKISDANKIKFFYTKTKTTGSKQRHLADLTFK